MAGLGRRRGSPGSPPTPGLCLKASRAAWELRFPCPTPDSSQPPAESGTASPIVERLRPQKLRQVPRTPHAGRL